MHEIFLGFLRDYSGTDEMEYSDLFSIVLTVPKTHADSVREAMGRAGAGDMGDYCFCSFTCQGTGRFKPKAGANPFIGKQGVLERVVEERIETVCRKDKLKEVFAAIKKAHPYEEPYVYVFPIQMDILPSA